MIIVALYDYVIMPDDELCGAGLSLTSSVKTCILRSARKLEKLIKLSSTAALVAQWQCGLSSNDAVLMHLVIVLVLKVVANKQTTLRSNVSKFEATSLGQ